MAPAKACPSHRGLSLPPRPLPPASSPQGDYAPSDLLCPKNKCWVPLDRVQASLAQVGGVAARGGGGEVTACVWAGMVI